MSVQQPGSIEEHLLARGPDDDGIPSAFGEMWKEASTVAAREGFLHWEAAFPGVWRDW